MTRHADVWLAGRPFGCLALCVQGDQDLRPGVGILPCYTCLPVSPFDKTHCGETFEDNCLYFSHFIFQVSEDYSTFQTVPD